MSRHIPRIAVVVAMLVLGAVFYGMRDNNPSDCPVDGDLPEPEQLQFRVVREIPHDPEAFTQGLAFHSGDLFESTGRRGESSIRRLDPDTGEVLEQDQLPEELFAEGLTGSGDELIQLTWTSETALRWEFDQSAGFSETGQFDYMGEGWGLATDPSDQLIMSDGTDTLQIRNPDSFELKDSGRVIRADESVGPLNELEYDGRHLWANQWKSDEILRINLDCDSGGMVDAVLDVGDLAERANDVSTSLGDESYQIDVLNGIAHVDNNRFLLTGKLWPVMFEVEISSA